jgi:L-rhamnose isomerase/sugar isomerase
MPPIASVTHPSTAPAIERIGWAMSGLSVELPSWGFVNTGTRFGIFPQPGVPRTAFEKIDDAATVNRFTGITGSVALHIPWDRVDDWPAFAAYAAERGLRIGGINSNTFQDQDYMLGSLCHPSAAVRAKAVRAIVEC